MYGLYWVMLRATVRLLSQSRIMKTGPKQQREAIIPETTPINIATVLRFLSSELLCFFLISRAHQTLPLHIPTLIQIDWIIRFVSSIY